MTPSGVVKFLEAVPICRGFSLEQRMALARVLKQQLVLSGGNLFKEGQPGDAFYIMVEGQVKVLKTYANDYRELVAVVGPGDAVGHMCLIDGMTRSATCTADTRSLVLKGERRLFQRLFNQGDALAFQFVEAIAVDLCRRLRATDQKMMELFSKPRETIVRLKEVSAQMAQNIAEDMRNIRVVPQEHLKQRSPRHPVWE